jgi:hypothetical protein
MATLDRKILCDRISPACSQCTRGDRKCKGYGVRLSWPREGDGRRAIVSTSPHRLVKRRNNRTVNAIMVRATHWDIEMYMFLSSLIPRAPLLHEPVRWNPHQLGEQEWDLLNYCKRSINLYACSKLTICKFDSKRSSLLPHSVPTQSLLQTWSCKFRRVAIR